MAELDVEALRELVMTALGEGSMCWEHIDEAGIFQSERAVEIGERLIAAIKSALEDRDRLQADWEHTIRQAIVLCNRNRPTMAGAILQAALDRWPTAALEGRDG